VGACSARGWRVAEGDVNWLGVGLGASAAGWAADGAATALSVCCFEAEVALAASWLGCGDWAVALGAVAADA
jgi:hypothetical protein